MAIKHSASLRRIVLACVVAPLLLWTPLSSSFERLCCDWSSTNTFRSTDATPSTRTVFLSSNRAARATFVTPERLVVIHPASRRRSTDATIPATRLFMAMTNGDSSSNSPPPSLLSSSSGNKSIGQHLIHAGECLQKAAANCFSGGPHLLRDTGDSLQDLGQAFCDDHWEAVMYAADDCSECFYELSQQSLRHPTLQKAYSAASGDLAGVSRVLPKDAFDADSIKPHFTLLSDHLQLASDYFLGKTATKKDDDENNKSSSLQPPIISDCTDVSQLSNLIQEASDSIGMLLKELR